MATLQQSPWQDNPFVKGQTLKELQEWTLNLVKEEQGVLSSKGVTK
jgi:hypothetical protein